METIQYLRDKLVNHSFEGSLEQLTTDYGIKVKSYPDQDVYLLNYDQIESPKFNTIVRECRSLVIDSKLNVVSRSFDRFFNHGEGECEVKFENSVALEKVDGSLIGLYFVPKMNQWHFRTRGTAFAEAQLPTEKSYQQAILETIGMSFEQLQESMSKVDKDITFIFEFVSPENRIVTRYQEPMMVLLAVREHNGKYPSYMKNDFVVELLKNEMPVCWKNVRECKSFQIKTVEDVENYISGLTDLQEGFVVLDREKNTRVKFKSPAYLKAHAIRGEGLTPKRVSELVAIGEEEEYLSVFPEDSDYFEKFISARKAILESVNEIYEKTKEIDSQKEFAIAVKDYPFSALLFTSRKAKCTPLHSWAESKESYRSNLILEFLEKQSAKN